MGMLEDVMSDAELEVETPEVKTNSVEDSEGLEIPSLEVSGIKIEGNTIEDALGNKWQVPGDNVDDLDDLYAGDVYKNIPKEITDRFHIQLIRQDELKEYLMRRFVPVTLKEIGIPEDLLKTGHPLDGLHCVGDAIMVKIPLQIHEAIQKRKEKAARQRLMDLEPTAADSSRNAGIDAGLQVEHKLGFTGADPSKRQGIYANERGEVVK